MDVKRDPAIIRRRRIRQGIALGVLAIAIVAVSVAVSRLQPAAPTIPGGTIWPGTIRRGPFVREVRGAGTLVPEEIRWIPSTTSGRVDRILLHQGAPLTAGAVILTMDNPDLDNQVRSAELDWKTAVAQLANQRATIETQRMQQEVAVANAQSDLNIAQSDLDSNKKLEAEGLVAELTITQKAATVEKAKNSVDLSKKQLASILANEESQMAPDEATVNQRKDAYDRLVAQREDLKVKSPMSGQLQLVSVEEGQQVGAGTNLVRVSDPARLKANIKIPETQTKDLRIGQEADIDTRSGHVPGTVSRIDAASDSGTVGVDVTLTGPLPPGSRPDLSVDGTIELEKLTNVLFVESPAFGQENTTISLFKILPNQDAIRTSVKLGRRSVTYVEIVDGLKEGDRVILSDMSQYDAYNRVHISN